MKLFLTTCLLLACLLPAATPLVNGDFELDDKGWKFPECAKTEAFAGRKGTAALVLQRTTPAEKDAVATQLLVLRPGQYYTLEAWVKCAELQNGSPTIGVEFFAGKKGKQPLTGNGKAITAPANASEWTCLTLDFYVPLEATATRLAITLPSQVTGTVWLDQLTLNPADYPIELALLYPLQGCIDGRTPRLRIAVAHPGTSNLSEELLRKTLRLNLEGHPQALRPATPIVEFPLDGPLNQDFLNATIELLDNDSQRIQTTLRISLRVIASADDLPANAITFDSRQRAIVNGQPILPIGLVASSPSDLPANSPFQFLLPAHETISTIHSSAELKDFLDNCQQRGLKTILPIDDCAWPWLNDLTPIIEVCRERLLADFASHPAVAIWRLATTAETDGEPRRQMIRTDYAHPVWQMLDGSRLPKNYLRAGDILGGKIDAPCAGYAENTLAKARVWTDELVATQLPTWMTLHFPVDGTATPEELRAITLLLAIQGAKGFLFDPSPLKNISQITELQYVNHIEILSTIAQSLQELAPFLLSDIPAREVTLTVKKGSAIAREFINPQGKKVILLIGGFLQGKTQATLSFPPNASVTSRFGTSKPKRNSVWTFEGKGLCADILEIEATK